MDKSMTNFQSFSKTLLSPALREDGVYIDFTMGNGYDTLFLAQSAPRGRVYAFDIQPQAVESTSRRLEQNGVTNVQLILDSHENLDKHVTGCIDGGMFNLGWLPGSVDKTVTTLFESTIAALSKGMALLRPDGIIVVQVYPGHDEGRREGELLQQWAASLPKYEYDVLLHRLLNVPDCQYLIAFQKKR